MKPPDRCGPLRLGLAVIVLGCLCFSGCEALVDESTFHDLMADGGRTNRNADVLEDVVEADADSHSGETTTPDSSTDAGDGAADSYADLVDEDTCSGASCGGICCTEGQVCYEAACCSPDCEGRECGDDGCGGSCGECVVDECLPGSFSPAVQKINVLEMGGGGNPGEALDIDNDPDTCAPADTCQGGLNNQMSGLVGQLAQFVDTDTELATALNEGQIILLLESVGLTTDGSSFGLNGYLGQADQSKEECDFQTEKCEYTILSDSIDPLTCLPLAAFDNARITDGKLTAGGPEMVFVVSLPVSDTVQLKLTALMAQIAGDVLFVSNEMFIQNGIIGGAIRKDSLMEAVDQIPDADPENPLPVSREMIKNLLDMFVVPDVDTDDDGEADAASIGIKFESIPGTISGAEGLLETVCNPDGQCVPL